jgi:hypothetical protein
MTYLASRTGNYRGCRCCICDNAHGHERTHTGDELLTAVECWIRQSDVRQQLNEMFVYS